MDDSNKFLGDLVKSGNVLFPVIHPLLEKICAFTMSTRDPVLQDDVINAFKTTPLSIFFTEMKVLRGRAGLVWHFLWFDAM